MTTIIDQNPILMLSVCKGAISTVADKDFSFEYKYVLKEMQCVEPTRECHFGKCTECPGIDHLRRVRLGIFDKENLSNIEYKQWVSTGRATLETFIKPVEQHRLVVGKIG